MTTRTADQTRLAIQRLEWLAFFLDSRYQIPGTRLRLGWDSLVGLVPAVGDVLTLILSTAILVYSGILGVPFRTLLRMLGNILLDVSVGAVPIAGDLFDVFWRANHRNVRMLIRHLEISPSDHPSQNPTGNRQPGLPPANS